MYDHHQKGTQMSKQSETLRSLAHRLGVSGPVRLRAFRGTGAPKITRGSSAFVVGMICVFTFGLTSTALAAPEEPKTEPATGETATTATLNGLLNPNAPGQPGSYQFDYAPAEFGACNAAGLVAPASPAFATGNEKEAVSTPLTGLEANREYLFCVVAFSLSAEPSSGAALTFKTHPAPPKIDGETAAVSSTKATLEAQINPNNEATNFTVEYATKATGEKLEGTIVEVNGAAPLEGGSDQAASIPTVEGLSAGTTYFYRVVAENAQSKAEVKPVKGAVKSFTTVPVPHTEAAVVTSATTATLHGKLTPLNATVASEYSFDYAAVAENCTAEGKSTTPASAGTGSGSKAVSANVTELQPSATYSVCLVSSNASGSEVDPTVQQQSFTTPAAPPSIESGSEKASTTPFEATLEAQVNPNNQETTYKFEYGTSKATVEAGHGTVVSPPAGTVLSGYGDQTASVGTGRVLTPGTPYFFRVLTENAAHEKTAGTVEPFTTPVALAPTIASESSSEVMAETAHLNAEINPEYQQTTCKFEYSSVKAELLAGKGTVKACPAALGDGGAVVGTSVKVTGLKYKTPYYFRVAATNASGTTTDASIGTFETENAEAPALSGETTANETSSTAELKAEVNPNGSLLTACTFEYGTGTSYGTPVPCAQGLGEAQGEVGNGRSPVSVSATATGLSANTEYHYRLTATNAAGTTTSADHTFIYSTTGTELPDDRAYEMVTPPFKNGAAIGYALSTRYSISGAGSSLIAYSIQCFAGSPECTGIRGKLGNPFELNRTSGGWVTTPLAPPATQFGEENSAWLAGADTGDALFSMPTGPAGEDEWYREGAPGSFQPIGPANPPGDTGVNSFATEAHLATADLSHLVWQTVLPFWPFDATKGSGNEQNPSVYEYAGTGNEKPLLVGVTGREGSDELISTCATLIGDSIIFRTQDALSANGRTVYFTATGDHVLSGGEKVNCTGSGANEHTLVPVQELYARVDGEEPSAHTVAISQPDAPEVAGEGAQSPPDENCTETECQKNITEEKNWRPAEFESASADGSRVFFLDSQQLTNSATQGTLSGQERCSEGGNDCNLYLYDAGEPAGHNLVDVSAGSSTPEVQGVVATSADGSHVYFVAKGVLTSAPSPDAQGLNAQGQPVPDNAVAQSGAENLYVFDSTTGQLAFIAPAGGLPTGNTTGYGGLANVTPEGRFLVFASTGQLTRDDHAAAGQIFRYDAATEQLLRISIGVQGYNDDGNAPSHEATIVEASDAEPDVAPARGDPTMSNDGAHVFFQSPLALTPHALNNVVIGIEHSGAPKYAQNVYEWEQEGHGSCPAGQSQGCVYLISDGHDTSVTHTVCGPRARGTAEIFESSVCLLGADETGDNVFFQTTDQLVEKDTDTQIDIYDARICEPENGNPCIEEPSPPLPPCDGENCHGIPAPTPSPPGGGTLTFNGVGNFTSSLGTSKPKPKTAAELRAEKLAKALKVCKRDKSKKKLQSCEKQARQKYGAKTKSKPKQASKSHKGAKS
jgi:hypothetical protein